MPPSYSRQSQGKALQGGTDLPPWSRERKGASEGRHSPSGQDSRRPADAVCAGVVTSGP